MDYFEKFKNIVKIRQLSDKRINQIHKESEIDESLKKCFHKYPELIFSYLMDIRNLNRQLSLETYNSSLINYAEKVENNINTFNDIYASFMTDSCDNLRVYLENSKKYL